MPGVRWTPHEVELLKENYPKRELSIQDVADITGHPRLGVALKARSLGLWKNWTPEEKELLIQLWSNPVVTVREICERLKRDKKAVYDMVHFLKLTKPSIPRRDLYWTEEQVELLRKHYADWDYETLVETLHRSQRAIYNMAKKLGLKTRKYGTQTPWRQKSKSDRERLLGEHPFCSAGNCFGWERVLDLHHEPDGSMYLLCPGHHAMITRGFAKITTGKFVLL